MSELNISDLPEEMLIKVFRLLDAANLKHATLTCKLWKNLIESACRWSLSLLLEHDKMDYRYLEQKINFILETNRKFASFEIVRGRLNEGSQILEIFRKHGFYVVKLGLFRVHIDSLIAFAELLNLTPNLKCVDLSHLRGVISYGASDVRDHILPDLKKLKNLVMFVGVNTDYGLIQCFQKAKLTTIQIYEYDYSKHSGTLAPFILSQDMLTSLIAESYARSPCILAEMGKLDIPIPFRLTKLAISDKGGRNSTHDHNLLKFVKSQTNSLTEMEIGTEIPSSVYECVFANMTYKLNTFGVILDHIPRNNDFYERLQKNDSIRTMKILAADEQIFPLDIKFFGNLLKKLPNIRNLFLSSNGCSHKNILAVAAQHLSKLEFLYMSFIDERLIKQIGCVNFPNLKTLHIGLLYVRIDWNEFTKIHSRLTELIIEEIDEKSFLTNDDIDQITTNVDLQNLKLDVGFVADDRFFEIIRIKCPNLKVLDLHKSCIPPEINYSKETNLLRLCDDHKWSRYSQMLGSRCEF